MSFRLTKRQKDLLDLLASGHSDREAYLRLRMSESLFNKEWAIVCEKFLNGVPTTIEGYKLLLSYERVIRQRIESELWASEAHLAAMMDTSLQAVFLINGRTGRIIKANNRAFTLFGYSPKELLNQPMEMLIEPELQQKHAALRNGFLNSTRKREMGYHPPISARTKSGDILDLDIALTATLATDDVMVVVREESLRKISEGFTLQVDDDSAA